MKDFMHISGAVTEYNPFHLGHAFHLQETRASGATHIVAVMSGNFVQRGEPALLSKWKRAEIAIRCGADLVIELPLPWAMATAERFAYGAVSLLSSLGCVKTLSFGSECGDADALNHAAQADESEAVQPLLRQKLSEGMTYARARTEAVETVYGKDTAYLLCSPNNALGIEYCKALHTLHTDIKPVTVKRVGALHDAEGHAQGYASASAVRKMIVAGEEYEEYLPREAAEIIRQEIAALRAPANPQRLERAVLAKLRCMSREEIAALPDISEGLENRIYEAVRRACGLEELYALVKTKRYTHARIRRIVLSAFLGLTAADSEGRPPYIRVLAFNGRGREILRQAKKSAQIPLIMRASDILSLDTRSLHMFELECRAADLYALSLPAVQKCGLDMTTERFIME